MVRKKIRNTRNKNETLHILLTRENEERAEVECAKRASASSMARDNGSPLAEKLDVPGEKIHINPKLKRRKSEFNITHHEYEIIHRKDETNEN